MRHTEHEYHEAGHRYERAPTPDSARAHAQVIRVMLQAESPDDHAYADTDQYTHADPNADEYAYDNAHADPHADHYAHADEYAYDNAHAD